MGKPQFDLYLNGEPCDTHGCAKCPKCKQEWFVNDWHPGDMDTTQEVCPRCGEELELTATVKVTIWAVGRKKK